MDRQLDLGRSLQIWLNLQNGVNALFDSTSTPQNLGTQVHMLSALMVRVQMIVGQRMMAAACVQTNRVYLPCNSAHSCAYRLMEVLVMVCICHRWLALSCSSMPELDVQESMSC